MFPKALSAVVALAASTMVSAQTFTDCNPLKTTCPADPAFGSGTVNCDFTKGACDALAPMEGTKISYNGQGAQFTINQDGQAPTVKSANYLFFGRVDVVVQAAQGQGIVTSAVLQSDDLDEIDWEWVGGDNAQVQTNYFSKGDTSTYDRGAYHPVSSPLTSYHTYSIVWTSSKIDWIVDGTTVRTLNAADAKGGSAFPQTPMQVKLGTWVGGGASNAPGTVTWAGGKTDFSKAPFNGYYKSITITDYAGADSAGKDAKEYVYGDNSGSASSIKVVGSSGSAGGVKERQTTFAPESTTTEAPAPSSTVEKPESKSTLITKTSEAVKETTTAAAPEKTTADSKETTVEKTSTASAPAETKPPVVHTTFSTLTAPSATTPTGSKTTGGSSSGSGSGSNSGSGSSSGSGSGSSGSTPAATSSGAGQTSTPVPASAATRMVGNTIMAAAGLVVLQFLI